MSGSFNIPEPIKQFNLAARGQAGVEWLERLPEILAACALRWDLRVGPPFEPLSINYVAPAVRRDGSPAVLKLSFKDREFFSEAGALQLYDGRACARLLEADLERGALLLERVLPGDALADIESVPANDAEVTAIAAGVMQRLWRPAPEGEHPFPSFRSWMEHMRERYGRILQRAPDFPAAWIERALAMYAELDDPDAPQVTLHGDFHHGNVLSSEREGWLAIDPKGVTGPPVAETGPLLLNALPQDLRLPETGSLLARRIARLSEVLGFEREALRDWSIVRMVLSAYWTVEDGGGRWRWGIGIAEILENL